MSWNAEDALADLLCTLPAYVDWLGVADEAAARARTHVRGLAVDDPNQMPTERPFAVLWQAGDDVTERIAVGAGATLTRTGSAMVLCCQEAADPADRPASEQAMREALDAWMEELMAASGNNDHIAVTRAGYEYAPTFPPRADEAATGSYLHAQIRVGWGL